MNVDEITSAPVEEKVSDETLPPIFRTAKEIIFVLKGVPLNFVGEENFHEDLTAAINDPLNYFIGLKGSGRKFLSHEEFLLLNAVIFAQYDSVYILKNNLFMEQLPIENKFGAATEILLEHFTYRTFYRYYGRRRFFSRRLQ